MANEMSVEWEEANDAQIPRFNARRRLYCYETLTGVDDAISVERQLNQSKAKTDQAHEYTVSQQSQKEEFNDNNQKIGKPKFNDKGNSHQVDKIHQIKSSNHREGSGKFIKGLLNEFKQQHMGNPFDKRDDLTKFEMKASSSHEQKWTATSLSIQENERVQEVPDIILEEEDSNPSEEEMLVIHDDMMTSSGIDSDSGSDIDWSSLTPPVPRSPSDQRVPEMESETDKNIKYDEQTHRIVHGPLDFLFGSGLYRFEQQSYSDPFHTSPRIESDQVVPQYSDST